MFVLESIRLLDVVCFVGDFRWRRPVLRCFLPQSELRAFPKQFLKAHKSVYRQSSANPFTFQDQVASHRPRAWERAPKSAFANRHRGRKVWKRYDLRAKEPSIQEQGAGSEILDPEEIELNNEQITRSSRPVKRLRAKHVPDNENNGGVVARTGYITTLRDAAPGTPRRECFDFAVSNGEP